ncbi:MAG: FKBP-type peptidyl-prolyl cis-trans isomerase, partial [Clostridia bacterium]|nr:FKBP-type peptidyl-prolyl cis-trans isomerase [Clostridia bacterium]
MRTKALILVLALCMLVTSFAGCAKTPYDYNLSEYIKLGKYHGVTIDLSDINAKIKAQYEEAAKADKTTNTYSKGEEGITVEEGDVANLDSVGKVDGKEFEGGKGTKYDLTIGSGQFIDGFEDGLIGAAVGETLDINVTFPENYGKEGTKQAELNGKAAVFTVTINSIKRTVYPEYNDANVEKYIKTYKTVAEFEAGVREDIEKDLLWAEFFEDTKVVKYPKKELERYYNNMVDSYTSTAASLGVDITTYASYMGYKDPATFFQYLASVCKTQVKQELIVYAMLEAEPVLKMTDKEFDVEAEALWKDYVEAESYDGDFEQFLKDNERESIELSIYYERIIK